VGARTLGRALHWGAYAEEGPPGLAGSSGEWPPGEGGTLGEGQRPGVAARRRPGHGRPRSGTDSPRGRCGANPSRPRWARSEPRRPRRSVVWPSTTSTRAHVRSQPWPGCEATRRPGSVEAWRRGRQGRARPRSGEAHARARPARSDAVSVGSGADAAGQGRPVRVGEGGG
jgi:hypothetical protein